MLQLSQAAEVSLPKYTLVDDFSKDSLLKFCQQDEELKLYLPDSPNLDCLPRNFLSTVSLLKHNLAYFLEKTRKVEVPR